MERKPDIVPLNLTAKSNPWLADVRKYAADPTLADRDFLLRQSAWQVSQFFDELSVDAPKITLLLMTT